MKRWKEDKTLGRKKGQGRKRKTSEREDADIIISVKRNRFITAKEFQDTFPIPHLCENTIRSSIKESGEFNSYWAVNKPFISEVN